MLGINRVVDTYKPLSYETDQETPADVLDCSLGINPYGCSEAALSALGGVTGADLSLYPHGAYLQQAIVQYWLPYVTLTPEHIVLGNGSMPILTGINRLFLSPGSRVLGVLPGFSAYSDDVRLTEAHYVGVHFEPSMTEDDVVQDFLEQMRAVKPELICLENPNNPTGMTFSKESVEQMVSLAGSMDIPILVDEAYGDYFPSKHSAIGLVGRYDNLIVARTFSKGLGLAGLRMGYGVGPVRVMENLLKVNTIFDGNALGRILANAALCDRDFVRKTAERVRVDKARLVGTLNHLKTYPTADTTPILALYTEQKIDLYDHLLRYGVNAVPGASFETLGRQGVRLILHHDIDELIERIVRADAGLAAH